VFTVDVKTGTYSKTIEDPTMALYSAGD